MDLNEFKAFILAKTKALISKCSGKFPPVAHVISSTNKLTYVLVSSKTPLTVPHTYKEANVHVIFLN